MTMETQPFGDVSPIKNGEFILPCWFWGGGVSEAGASFYVTRKKTEAT